MVLSGMGKTDGNGIVIFSYDPPMPKGKKEPTQKELEEKYKTDPEYRRLVDEFWK